MFSHIVIGADDLDGARLFFDTTLGALGVSPSQAGENGRLIYMHGGSVFMVTRPIDGKPASCANGGTVGFQAASPAAVDAWHAAGVAAGGTSCENPPGIREGGFGKLYLAYLRDPSGNKLCAAHRFPPEA